MGNGCKAEECIVRECLAEHGMIFNKNVSFPAFLCETPVWNDEQSNCRYCPLIEKDTLKKILICILNDDALEGVLKAFDSIPFTYCSKNCNRIYELEAKTTFPRYWEIQSQTKADVYKFCTHGQDLRYYDESDAPFPKCALLFLIATEIYLRGRSDGDIMDRIFWLFCKNRRCAQEKMGMLRDVKDQAYCQSAGTSGNFFRHASDEIGLEIQNIFSFLTKYLSLSTDKYMLAGLERNLVSYLLGLNGEEKSDYQVSA